MPLDILELDGKWELKDAEYSGYDAEKSPAEELNGSGWMQTDVPGDIHPALVEAGRIPDPFIDQNTKECSWTTERSWWFKRDFEVPEKFDGKTLKLVFDGIDTYASIYVNDKKIGQTENSFLQYKFDVTDQINTGETNSVAVCIYATKAVIESIDTSKYFACFYTPRIFARKAQCQFSWDWAPELPALGIWQSVRLEALSTGVIEDVYIRTRTSGKTAFNVKLDLETKKRIKAGEQYFIEASVTKDGYKKTVKTEALGKKNFLTLDIEDPKLWWPNGYGKAELYDYKVMLISPDRKQLDTKKGTFGIREVELIEEFNEDQICTFKFHINGREVFCLGANWVPVSCFPGEVNEDKYERLLKLAKDANMNMIRIWGGGIYEKDVFYELCDKYGLMVWQDLMFACSDIPDDNLDWTYKLISEFEYQLRRLRNHPCIVHWCGGNEKTGAFGEQKSHGDLVTNYLGRGVVNHLMPDLAYTPSSPYSLTDIGNDASSGDSHGGTWEDAFKDGIQSYREHIDKKRASFMSEFGFHGPPALKSIKKFIPEDMLWPLNGSWEHHIMDNPYSSLKESFLEVQYNSVCQMFHKPHSAGEFVKLAGTFYAQYLYEEFQHHRRCKPQNAGALIWMLNDCWPAASWSIIDYYGVPKQAYYAIKRASKPVMLSFRDAGGCCELYITHNKPEKLSGKARISLMDVVGNKHPLASAQVDINAHSSKSVISIEKEIIKDSDNSFLLGEFETKDGAYRETFFHNFWKNIKWIEPNLSFEIAGEKKTLRGFKTTVVIKTQKYARTVYLSFDDDEKIFISDNYFDMLPASSKEIIIESPRQLKKEDIKILHWLDKWD